MLNSPFTELNNAHTEQKYELAIQKWYSPVLNIKHQNDNALFNDKKVIQGIFSMIQEKWLEIGELQYFFIFKLFYS